MLRPTEPMIIRLSNNRFGVWVERTNEESPYESVLGKRIEEMFDYVNNTKDTIATIRKESQATFSIYQVSKHFVANRPDPSWLDPADALLAQKETITIDFSDYSAGNTIGETFAILSRNELQAFWNIVNMNDDEQQRPVIVLPRNTKRSSQARKFYKALYDLASEGPQVIVD